MWEVEFTDEFEEWWDTLSEDQQDAVRERVDLLAQRGPALKRPLVGEVQGSAFGAQMKELRASRDGHLRVLLCFDPRRTAILLLGGDKTGQWNRWYRTAVPTADALYREHLRELRDEGLI